MNKTILAIVIAVIVLAGAGALVAKSNGSQNGSESMQMSYADEMDKASNEAQNEDSMMQDTDSMMHDDSSMENEDATQMKHTDTYITLAEYEANKDAYTDKKKVHFFHASWCPTCQSIEKEINADPSRIPADSVFIKTDFDTETALRQKYGVTVQYTFVQVDNDGNEIGQWTVTNLEKAVANIKS